MKIFIAIVHTLIGAVFSFFFGFALLWYIGMGDLAEASPLPYLLGLGIIVIVTSIVATWRYALTSTVSVPVKILAFAALPIYLYFAKDIVDPYISNPSYAPPMEQIPLSEGR